MLCCSTLFTPLFCSTISIMALICPTGVYSDIRCAEMYYQYVIIKSTTWNQLDFFLPSGSAQAAECDIVVGGSRCCWWDTYTSLGALSASLCSDSFSSQKCKIEVVEMGRACRISYWCWIKNSVLVLMRVGKCWLSLQLFYGSRYSFNCFL